MSIPFNELPWFRRPQSEARQPQPEMCNIQEAEQEIEFHRLESSKTQEPRQPHSLQNVEEQELKRPHSAPCIAQVNKNQDIKHAQSVPCISQNAEKHAAKLPKGQIISKGLLVSSYSPKIGTNERMNERTNLFFATTTNSFFVFWENLRTPKGPFEVI